jgi:putative hydrolase
MARMDLPFGGDPDAFADAPLFRELQRVMSSSSGPVNWELARQVGIANAQEGREDLSPTDHDRELLEEVVRVAELHVARFTGLEPPTDVAEVRPVRRADGVTANTESLRELLDPAAQRISAAMGEATGRMLPGGDELPEALRDQGMDAGQLGALLQQLSPLLLGAQVGTVLGFLGQRVLGQYDVAVPRSGHAALLFVVPNLAAFERDWSLDPTEFRTLVALHEVTHRFEFARPWVRDRFTELLTDFLSTLTIDVGAMQERLAHLDGADPDAMQSLMSSEEGLFGTVLDDEQRIKLGRIQAFMAAAEGYGDHVMQTLGRQLLSTYGRIDEARKRLDAEPSTVLLSRLFGIDVGEDDLALGLSFCETVASEASEDVLGRMWDDAEAMPSKVELETPSLWISRSL